MINIQLLFKKRIVVKKKRRFKITYLYALSQTSKNKNKVHSFIIYFFFRFFFTLLIVNIRLIIMLLDFFNIVWEEFNESKIKEKKIKIIIIKQFSENVFIKLRNKTMWSREIETPDKFEIFLLRFIRYVEIKDN